MVECDHEPEWFVFVPIDTAMTYWLQTTPGLCFEFEGACCGTTKCPGCKLGGFTVNFDNSKCVETSCEVLEFQRKTRAHKIANEIEDWLYEQFIMSDDANKRRKVDSEEKK